MAHTIRVTLPTIAKFTKEPKDSSNVTYNEKQFLKPETLVSVSEILDHKAQHLQIVSSDLIKSPAWLFIPHLDTNNLPDDLFRRLPLDKLLKMGINKILAEKYIDGLNKTFAEFKIDTCKRQSTFLAQIFHESGGMQWNQELASGQAYEWRKDLGNIYAGDGKRFKGRGLIQLTGRHNYGVAGRELGLDLINRPELAATPDNAPRIAGWYWNSRKLNVIADKHNIEAFQQITRRINGGLNGYKDRLHWWGITRKVLGC
ncbi:glycoside hydrolase family 19 protein [Geminocystis sp. NIES-3709]|uniref:glycoside hydrolase family 19 protein n=1 Tax=Geminocystis sp. NIES-3709 TaxID=1617448 RepID=UPI0005FC3EBC|nr:glycoside hydrolase family 19 protein [Geminocystis sp. NIES-3709]BAQ67065.1 phage endolysin [Geminocystis sp. NIES-3709]